MLLGFRLLTLRSWVKGKKTVPDSRYATKKPRKYFPRFEATRISTISKTLFMSFNVIIHESLYIQWHRASEVDSS